MNLVDELVVGWSHELQRDHMALWHIAKEIRHRMPSATDNEIRATAMEVIRRLLLDPSVQISTFDIPDSRYDGPWPGSRDDILARLEREWLSLGRDPGPGEIGYINNSRYIHP